jgi:putative transposase
MKGVKMINVKEVIFAMCMIREIMFQRHARLVAHKIELFPTKEQSEYLLQAVGSRRFAYNHLVAYYREHKQLTKSKSVELIKEFSTRVVRNTVDDIDKAIKRAWLAPVVKKRQETIAKAVTPKQKVRAFHHGMPNFARKGINESFAIREQEKIRVKGKRFKFEKMPTLIKMRNFIRFEGNVKQVTISLKDGKWFASFLVETLSIQPKQEPRLDSVGVDVGIKELATLSNGVVFPKSQPLKAKLRKLKILQRKLSKQVRGGANYNKTLLKVQTVHYYVSQARKAVLHELTSYLVTNFKRVAIEDLNVSGMVKNHKLARAISDVGFGAFREYLSYKCKMYDVNLVLVDRFFPSSKTCSKCGNVKKELKLSQRVYTCNSCDLVIDRDLNASLNINQWLATGSGDN